MAPLRPLTRVAERRRVVCSNRLALRCANSPFCAASPPMRPNIIGARLFALAPPPVRHAFFCRRRSSSSRAARCNSIGAALFWPLAPRRGRASARMAPSPPPSPPQPSPPRLPPPQRGCATIINVNGGGAPARFSVWSSGGARLLKSAVVVTLGFARLSARSLVWPPSPPAAVSSARPGGPQPPNPCVDLVGGHVNEGDAAESSVKGGVRCDGRRARHSHLFGRPQGSARARRRRRHRRRRRRRCSRRSRSRVVASRGQPRGTAFIIAAYHPPLASPTLKLATAARSLANRTVAISTAAKFAFGAARASSAASARARPPAIYSTSAALPPRVTSENTFFIGRRPQLAAAAATWALRRAHVCAPFAASTAATPRVFSQRLSRTRVFVLQTGDFRLSLLPP